jgi:hypothetical protein
MQSFFGPFLVSVRVTRGKGRGRGQTEFLDKAADFSNPCYWHVLIFEFSTVQFITRLVADDGRVFSI